jgi:eukaryotic-like serine/threonine-protein kinase
VEGVGAAKSRKMVRARMGAGTTEEESRARLQTRLTTLYKVMFWANIALLAFLQLTYNATDTYTPKNNSTIFAIAAVGVVLMAFNWRVLLVGKPRSFGVLHQIDNMFTIGSGAVYGAAAGLAHDLRASAYTCLIYLCSALLTRALLVPSTGRRTAIVCSLAFAPMTATGVFLAVKTQQEVHGPAYFAGYIVVAAVTVLLSATGSSIIYGLRREVDAAVQLGRYKLEGLIGKGGLGEVYLAHHVMLRRPTAIKVLRPDRVNAEDIARFIREVHATSQLTHPNTVAVFDYGPTADGSSFYYAMEYLGGGLDLERLVQRDGPIPAQRVVSIITQACGALQEAHDAGIVHRDVTPTNIMLCRRGGMPDIVKVLDFGLAQVFTAEIGESQQIVHGTPHYMAPETISTGKAEPAADLYALGCVAYFLLTGKTLFEGKTALDICMKHVTDTPALPSRVTATPVPHSLELVIMKCLEKQPHDRYASATELADALTALGFTDWTDELASAWWREHELADEPTGSSISRTITVDVEHREAP